MLKRLDEWWRRVAFPKVAKASLGFGSEYWDPDPSHYEGCEQLRARYAALGQTRSDSQLAWDLASHLLSDVLVAAGGVESAMERMDAAVAELEAYAKKYGRQAEQGVPCGLSHPAAVQLWYAFTDVVSWSRTLVERLDRRPENRKLERQGLIPALRPQLLRDCAMISQLGKEKNQKIPNPLLATATWPVPSAVPGAPVGNWDARTKRSSRQTVVVVWLPQL